MTAKGVANIDHAELWYAAEALVVDGAKLTVDHTLLTKSSGGLRANGAAASARLRNSSITENQAGVTATNGAAITAADNWWGAVDGPGGDAPGTGNTVVGAVTYEPFATAEP